MATNKQYGGESRLTSQTHAVQTYSRRPVGQIVAPVFAILRELFGRTISSILLQENIERRKRIVIMRAAAGAEASIDVCQTARDQTHAERIHDDMVVARVPKITTAMS